MAADRVLVIEDDPAMRRALADNYQHAGYDVLTAAEGEAGLRKALDERPDLVILDLMLPRVNGYEICRQVRGAGLVYPIIMLTAKGQESDIVRGLEVGADDYVTKPFSIRELMARSKAFLRRRHGAGEKVCRFGRYALDRDARRLMQGGVEVVLTPKEFALLELLVERAGRVLTRDTILRQVWGHNVFVTGRSVDRCVATLRRKIEVDPRRPVFIQTAREVGYRFEAG